MKLKDVAALIDGKLRGDGAVEVSGVAALPDATGSDLSLVTSAKHAGQAAASKAACLVVPEFLDEIKAAQIKVPDPEMSFFGVLIERFRPRPSWPEGVSDRAFIEPGADISEDASVMPLAYVSAGASVGAGSVICPGVFIGQGASVGAGCLIYPNVSVMDGVSLGDRVIVHSGTVIGSDGYGFMQRQGRHVKKPQVGGVIIGDDVEIQANCAIDRATLGNTVIGAGAKLDNLVHIAHNVSVGEGSLLTGQTAIAGSSTVGKHVILAGQAGVKDHVDVPDNTVIAAKSAVLSDIKEGGMYAGIPAMPIQGWLRSSAVFAKLPEMNKRLRALERRLEELEREKGEKRNDER